MTNSYPELTYSGLKVTYSDPKVTYRDLIDGGVVATKFSVSFMLRQTLKIQNFRKFKTF